MMSLFGLMHLSTTPLWRLGIAHCTGRKSGKSKCVTAVRCLRFSARFHLSVSDACGPISWLSATTT